MRALLVALLLAPCVALLPGSAQAQGADAQGWWSALNQPGAPALPAPPDVAADDLLLQGGDPARLLPATGVVDQAPAPSALAALRFTVRPGSVVGSLVLTVAAGAQATDVRAYPARGAWQPAQGGAAADAPQPDLSRYSAGRLSADGLTLDFPDIGRLVTEQGLLSVVLVPGAADRVVVHQPTKQALTVTPTDLAPPLQPEAPPPVPALVVAPAPLTVPYLTAPLAAPDLEPTAAPQAPTVAVAAPVRAAAPAALSRRLIPDDTRSRVIVLLELLFAVAFFGLLGQGPLAVLARLTGQPLGGDEQRGVGRFRTSRTGVAPRL
jgi:hypothetical protein